MAIRAEVRWWRQPPGEGTEAAEVSGLTDSREGMMSDPVLRPSSYPTAQPATPGLSGRPASSQERINAGMNCGLTKPCLKPETGYQVLVLILVLIITMLRTRYAADTPVIPVTLVLGAAGYVTGAARTGRRPSYTPGLLF